MPWIAYNWLLCHLLQATHTTRINSFHKIKYLINTNVTNYGTTLVKQVLYLLLYHNVVAVYVWMAATSLIHLCISYFVEVAYGGQ
jgi:hypothetical protein